MKTLLYVLESKSPIYIWLFSFGFILLISWLSELFGEYFYASLLLIFPIVLTSWYGSKRSGIIIALVSVLSLLISQRFFHDQPWVASISFILSAGLSYILLAILITDFHNVHEIESSAADTDELTKLYNTRGFYIQFAEELQRTARYPHTFSLAYMDIDNFKFINDMFGHAEGDRVLVEVASCLKKSLRMTDTIARVGGDEFICLLPETDQNAAIAAFKKASSNLKKQMKSYSWPVGFSVGMVTFEVMPTSMKEAIKLADELMYTVKKSNKNKISYKIWQGKV